MTVSITASQHTLPGPKAVPTLENKLCLPELSLCDVKNVNADAKYRPNKNNDMRMLIYIPQEQRLTLNTQLCGQGHLFISVMSHNGGALDTA
jgi:hypothetical protein